MSWGIRIAILYLSFVSLIITLAVTCFGHKVELESKDYYAKELKYQDQLDATGNANNLSINIDHKVNEKEIVIFIPKELLSNDFKGEVYFLRPSDSSQDKKLKLQPDSNGKYLIPKSIFIKGVYKMQISIICNHKNFYKENIINL